jgi:hypothetical protein
MGENGLQSEAGGMVVARPTRAARALFLSFAMTLPMASFVLAQSELTSVPAPETAKANASTATPAPVSTEVGAAWESLNPVQKVALAPLAAAWPVLSEDHKNKWIALVQKFPEMAETDRSRLLDRMVDWAALSPKDREIARLNFAQTKKLSTDARVANWEAYQALPDSKKQQLLKAAPKKPVGVAVTVKPVPANKLAQVPVTRKTPEPQRAAVSQRNMVDRYTLLPQSAGSKNSVPAPDPSGK